MSGGSSASQRQIEAALGAVGGGGGVTGGRRGAGQCHHRASRRNPPEFSACSDAARLSKVKAKAEGFCETICPGIERGSNMSQHEDVALGFVLQVLGPVDI